jgi:hypothetical protein
MFEARLVQGNLLKKVKLLSILKISVSSLSFYKSRFLEVNNSDHMMFIPDLDPGSGPGSRIRTLLFTHPGSIRIGNTNHRALRYP